MENSGSRFDNSPGGRLSAWASNIPMFVACVIILLMMGHVTLDVLGKKLLNRPFPATLETVQFYYMVGLVFLPFAYITRNQGHICVELFTQKMSYRSRAGLEAVVGVLTLIWVLLIAWYAGEEAILTTRDNELQETSTGYLIVWPGRWFIPVGAFLMAIAVIVQIMRDIRHWRHGDPDAGQPQANEAGS